jgi:hypothetical protein
MEDRNQGSSVIHWAHVASTSMVLALGKVPGPHLSPLIRTSRLTRLEESAGAVEDRSPVAGRGIAC